MPMTNPAQVVVPRELLESIVSGAMPATVSGQTCFVPSYQLDKLRDLLAAPTPDAQPAGDGDHRDRWITQTIFYDPNQPPEVCSGNCTEAAFASIFGLHLDEVPSFQGLRSSNYWDAVEAFVSSRGYRLVMMKPNFSPEGCLYLADGPSERGCGHFVVMRDRQLIHDPHPSRLGITAVERVWVLIPHDPMTSGSGSKRLPCVCSSEEGDTCTEQYGPDCLYGPSTFAQPRSAGAVDLEQFRGPICSWREDALKRVNVSDRGTTIIMEERIAEANRLLAVIDNAALTASQPGVEVTEAGGACPHGVDDGACMECYEAALSGEAGNG